MSTRGQIKVKGSEIMIYKHSDSYPGGVMPTLKEIVKTFADKRGNDPAYALAQIMRAFARRDEKRRLERLEETKERIREANDREESGLLSELEVWLKMYQKHSMTGWGLDCVQHGDIEYLYEVDLEKRTITIYDLWEGTEEVVKV
jgi:hypothetical protein